VVFFWPIKSVTTWEEIMKTQLSAGGFVETRCTRCRDIKNHTIVAMVGEKIARVECNTCHGTHNYHPLKADKGTASARDPQKKAATTRTARPDPAAAAAAEWEALQSGMDASQSIPYDMNGKHRLGTLLLHPVFGLGIVRLVMPPNKIEVLFQGGKKLLRCG
jgi:hypothetical protein